MFLVYLDNNSSLTIERHSMDGTYNMTVIFTNNMLSMEHDLSTPNAVTIHYMRTTDILYVAIKDGSKIIYFARSTGQYSSQGRM